MLSVEHFSTLMELQEHPQQDNEANVVSVSAYDSNLLSFQCCSGGVDIHAAWDAGAHPQLGHRI